MMNSKVDYVTKGDFMAKKATGKKKQKPKKDMGPIVTGGGPKKKKAGKK